MSDADEQAVQEELRREFVDFLTRYVGFSMEDVQIFLFNLEQNADVRWRD